MEERFFSRVYSKQSGCLMAVIVLLAAAAVVFLRPEWQISLGDRTLRFQHIQEVAAGADGSLYLNDDGKRVFALRPDGGLKYVVRVDSFGKEARISGITADDQGRLFLRVWDNLDGGVQEWGSRLCMYDVTGKLQKILYTADYQPEEQLQADSPLYVQDGKLVFIERHSLYNRFYQIDVETGELRQLIRQDFAVPYLYQNIFLMADQAYCYAKIDGETGYGKIGEREKPAFQYVYDILRGGPFISSIFALQGQIYAYDAHQKTVWRIEPEAAQPFQEASVVPSGEIVYANAVNGYLCGAGRDQVWYAGTDGTLRTFSCANLTVAQALCEALVRCAYFLSVFLLAAGLVYFLGGIVHVYHGPSTSLLNKQLMLLPIVLLVILYMMFTVFRFYQRNYAQRELQQISREVQMVAGGFEGDSLISAGNSLFFRQTVYRSITKRLQESFPADLTVQILLRSPTGVYVFAGSGKDRSLLSLHEPADAEELSGLLAQHATRNGTSVLQHGDSYRFYAPIHTSDGEVVGWLYAAAPAALSYRGFGDTVWALLPKLLVCIAMLALLLVLLAWRLGRSAAAASEAITAISRGDLQVRISDIGNDEIGKISCCINHMAENLEASFKRNAELNREIRETQLDVIASFAEITEAKSGQTGHHVKRVAEYTRVLARAAGYCAEEVETIALASMMHDVGKLLLPNGILDKPGRLTEEDFAIVKRHSQYGEQLLHNVPNKALKYARIIALEHHERYGGGGYPDNRRGREIHPLARMVSIADVFDALVSKRSYKESWSVDKAFREVLAQSGQQFDPYFVELFLAHRAEIEEIVERLSDEN